MRRPAGKKQEILGDIDAKTAARLIGSSSDIALVLDSGGLVLDVIVQDAALAALVGGGWKGRRWVDSVTVESREKIESLLREAVAGAPSRWRQINHTLPDHDDLPVVYAAVRLNDDDVAEGLPCLVAFGRDLRANVQLQRRLVEAQQAIDRKSVV